MNRYLALALLMALTGSPPPGEGQLAGERLGAAAPGTAVRAGERLEFTAGMGLLQQAAVVTIETLPAPGTRHGPELRLLATVEPGALVSTFYAFSYRQITTVRTPGMTPRSASRQVREGDEQSFLAFSYRHDEGYVGLSEQARGPDQARDSITTDTYDMLSAIFLLRTLDPAKGSSFAVYENRHLYRLSFVPPELEQVEVPAGKFSAWHYVLRVDAAGETLTRPEIEVWIEQQGPRRPLRIMATTKYGALSLELTGSHDTAPPRAGTAGASQD